MVTMVKEINSLWSHNRERQITSSHSVRSNTIKKHLEALAEDQKLCGWITSKIGWEENTTEACEHRFQIFKSTKKAGAKFNDLFP